MSTDNGETAIDACVTHNARHASAPPTTALPGRPAMRLAIVTCMDARVDPVTLLGLSAGDAHVIRNAGGVVTDDVVRSLVLSQRLLGTREIMLVHHTDCGMLTFTDAELEERIVAETGARPSFAMGSFADLETDVRESIARLHASPFLRHTDVIRGFVCEVERGRLREVS